MAAVDQNKMQRTCRLIGGFALFVMAAIPLFLAAFWLDPFHFAFGYSTALQDLVAEGYISVDDFSAGDKLAGFLANGMPVAAVMLAAWHIRRLMALFAAGTYITTASVHYLRVIALSLMALPLLSILSNTVLILALTIGNPEGQRLLSIGLGGEEVIGFLFGLLVWMITRAFEVERERAEEHASIV